MAEIIVHEGDLPASLDFGKSVAIDTETMGLNLHRDKLCLVQLSAGDGVAHLVKVNGEAPNLKKLLEDESVLKIFHYGRFDIAALHKTFGADVKPVYCTKIASKLVRTNAPSHSLKTLCSELLGVELDKEMQTSYWNTPVLTAQQQKYAANDVLYLHQIKKILDERLAVFNRTEMAQKCFDFLPTRALLDLEGWNDEDIFAH